MPYQQQTNSGFKDKPGVAGEGKSFNIYIVWDIIFFYLNYDSSIICLIYHLLWGNQCILMSHHSTSTSISKHYTSQHVATNKSQCWICCFPLAQLWLNRQPRRLKQFSPTDGAHHEAVTENWLITLTYIPNAEKRIGSTKYSAYNLIN